MKLGIRGKLFSASVVLILVAGAVSGFFIEAELRTSLERRIETELVQFASLGAESARGLATEPDPTRDPRVAYDRLANRLGKAAGARITLLDGDGKVLGDSSLKLEELLALESHGDRPEFKSALAHGNATSRRYSATLGTDMIYAAVRYDAEGREGVVRAAMPLDEVDQFVWSLHVLLLGAASVGLVVALLMSGLSSFLVSRTVNRLVDHARSLARGERDRIDIDSTDELGRLAKSFNRLAEALQRSARKMAKEKDRFAAVLESMNDAVLALSAKGRIKVVNPLALELLGLTESCVGQTLIEATRIPELHELTDRAKEGPASAEFQLPSGRTVLANATPLSITNGTVIVMLDVTEMRRLETVRKDFVANVSHELRTPVSVIRANAETLVDGGLDDATRGPRFVDAILRNAERLTVLLTDLLDLSRIEAGKYNLEVLPIGVKDIVRQCVDSLAGEAAERNIELDTSGTDDLEAVADTKALEQILFNLVQNAIKYSGEGGHVRVQTKQLEDMVRIEVLDDGPGIAPQHRERIFERFYRIDAGRSREMGGTGLGLAIVKHLVDSMGGGVGVDAVSPHGSLFWVELPRSRQARLRLMA